MSMNTQATTATEALERLEVLSEDHYALCEQYGDLNAEYRGEVARFGDAWPGAAIQVAGLLHAITDVEAELAALVAAYPVHGPDVPAPIVEDEPF